MGLCLVQKKGLQLSFLSAMLPRPWQGLCWHCRGHRAVLGGTGCQLRLGLVCPVPQLCHLSLTRSCAVAPGTDGVVWIGNNPPNPGTRDVGQLFLLFSDPLLQSPTVRCFCVHLLDLEVVEREGVLTFQVRNIYHPLYKSWEI